MTYQVQVINGMAEQIHKVVVHRFEIAAEEDAVVMAAPHLLNWEHSDQGQWIMSHAMETPVWHKYEDPMHYLVKFAVTAKLRGRDYTFWTMKWNSQ
jgi:hypothetical protein